MKCLLAMAAALAAGVATRADVDQESQFQVQVQSQPSADNVQSAKDDSSPDQQARKTISDWSAMIKDDPMRPELYQFRGQEFYQRGDMRKAIADFSKAIELNPKFDMAYACRGDALLAQGQYMRAKSDYEAALRLLPADSPPAKKIVPCNFAWLLATCPDSEVRDGARAVKLARKACEEYQWKESNALDTFAAAHAEAGDFRSAIKWETQAMKLAAGDKEFQKGAEKRLALYKKNKPYRDVAPAK